ncbi:hypothetical protein BDD12DRAFT_880768 [Trichophaea hybrida]|nr:hypothetical protein BDD12DRAFT_880768 [Trichophaea hybrida]
MLDCNRRGVLVDKEIWIMLLHVKINCGPLLDPFTEDRLESVAIDRNEHTSVMCDLDGKGALMEVSLCVDENSPARVVVHFQTANSPEDHDLEGPCKRKPPWTLVVRLTAVLTSLTWSITPDSPVQVEAVFGCKISQFAEDEEIHSECGND